MNFEYQEDFYGSLLLGIPFIFIGAFSIIISFKKKRDFSLNFRLLFYSIFLFVGIVVTIGTLLGPSPSENYYYDKSILNLKEPDIQKIIIDPEYNNSSNYNFVNKSYIITNKREIGSICANLKSSKIIGPNHPHQNWGCYLTIDTVDSSFKIEVSSTSNQGVILWLRQPYRCDEIGSTLETIVGRHKKL